MDGCWRSTLPARPLRVCCLWVAVESGGYFICWVSISLCISSEGLFHWMVLWWAGDLPSPSAGPPVRGSSRYRTHPRELKHLREIPSKQLLELLHRCLLGWRTCQHGRRAKCQTTSRLCRGTWAPCSSLTTWCAAVPACSLANPSPQNATHGPHQIHLLFHPILSL